MPRIVARIVELCVFRLEGNRPEYLLLRRSHDDRIYPGIWQWVTGSIRDGEEAVKAALRELAEETGLKPKRFWVVPHVNSFYVAADDTMHLSPVFAAEVAGGGTPRLSPEHQSFEWCKYEEARGRLVWPGQRLGLEIIQQYITTHEVAAQLTEVSV